MLTRSDGMFDYVCNCNETSHFVKLKFGRSPFPFTEKMFVALANEVSIFLLILATLLDDFLRTMISRDFSSNFSTVVTCYEFLMHHLS